MIFNTETQFIWFWGGPSPFTKKNKTPFQQKNAAALPFVPSETSLVGFTLNSNQTLAGKREPRRKIHAKLVFVRRKQWELRPSFSFSLLFFRFTFSSSFFHLSFVLLTQKCSTKYFSFSLDNKLIMKLWFYFFHCWDARFHW